jgi:PAS domain S-box-containing protein
MARPSCPILLVDDQPANLLALEAVLQELGEDLVRAGSGDEALRQLRDADFAAILLDVRMPGMDGFETARLIRSQRRSRATPIIFITADATDLSVEEAYSIGAVDLLTKPLLPAVLKAKVAFFVELHRSKQELQAAEQQAVQDRAFLAAVLEAIEDGVVACGADGVLTLFNRAIREFHGMPAQALGTDEWAGRHDLYCADGKTPLAEEDIPLFRAFSGEHVHDVEVVIAPAGAKPRMVRASGQPLYDKVGRKLGAVVSMHDVTARQEAQAAGEAAAREQDRRRAAEAAAELIRESSERLRASEERLQRLAAELAETDRRKTEFLATLAHELRNPLAPISNGLQLMRMGPSDPQAQAKARDMLERQLRHLVRLVDDLLDIARISSGKVHLKKERVALTGVLNGAVESSMPLVSAAGHTLVLDMPDENLELVADPTRLGQVVSNLLNNAAKYTPSGGRIELAVRRERNELAISVADSGIGIAPDALPHLFEMFSQVGNDRNRSQGGLGIGLALVRSLVELHGGSVSAQSAGVGQGSKFTVRLPLASRAAASTPVNAPAAETHSPAPFRVLVVDDNVDAAESLAALLDLAGHATRIAHDGEQALRTAYEFLPEVVFLDIGMPGKDGYEVAKALRQKPETQQAVLVALTGWGAKDDRARSRKAGFDHHLTKPAGLAAVEDLLTRIETRAGAAAD